MSKLYQRLRTQLQDSLLGRIVLVMTVGVVCAQLVGTLIWARQLREGTRTEALEAGQLLAASAAHATRFLISLPAAERATLMAQWRSMGGTRFFATTNQTQVPVEALHDDGLIAAIVDVVQRRFAQSMPGKPLPQVAFAWPQTLQLNKQGGGITDIATAWVDAPLVLRPRPVPVLVIQTELEPGNWLYLASPMPDPYFLDNANPFSSDRIGLQLITLATVLALTVLIVRLLIKPLDRIAEAANAFGGVTTQEPLPETGTAELRRTARAFNGMQARIKGYLLDRERLFAGISHGLKTPIMRLKLRTELLDDEAMRAEFHEDLDDLDMMVKSALQSLRDTDIHENTEALRLDKLLNRLVRRPIYPDASIQYTSSAVRIHGKPLALERALGNLLDNGVLYGKRIVVQLRRDEGMARIEIRDFGPGIPEASRSAVFEPSVRLNHGQESNRGGSGLGMGIARNIIQAHGGSIALDNHPQGGLVVTVQIPALPADVESA